MILFSDKDKDGKDKKYATKQKKKVAKVSFTTDFFF